METRIPTKSEQIEIATAARAKLGGFVEIDGAWFSVSLCGSELRFLETSQVAKRSAHVLRPDLAYAPIRPTPYQDKGLDARCVAIVTRALAALA